MLSLSLTDALPGVPPTTDPGVAAPFGVNPIKPKKPYGQKMYCDGILRPLCNTLQLILVGCNPPNVVQSVAANSFMSALEARKFTACAFHLINDTINIKISANSHLRFTLFENITAL